MKEYGLGPNGAIVTALNLFATQFDSVVNFIDQKAKGKREKDDEEGEMLTSCFSDIEFCLMDTPGQIEVFTWSASGTIITDSLAVSFPTCVLYVLDATRCSSPATFMSNMLYACSILYKTRLPFVLAFNKCDAASAALPMEWMKDFDVLHDALAAEEGYMSNLVRSMSLVLQGFYETLTCVACSALTGENVDAVIAAIEGTREEYIKDYLGPLQQRMQKREQEKEQNVERANDDDDDDDDDERNEWDDENEE